MNDFYWIIPQYNAQIGNVITIPTYNQYDPDASITREVSEIPIEIFSLSQAIDQSKVFSFKFSLFPYDPTSVLLDFDSSEFTNTLLQTEEYLSNKLRWMAFYPKYNIIFERKMQVPIINTSMLTCDDDIKSVFQIPIEVIYYVLFSNKLTTIVRNYNSSIQFDHTGYSNIPDFLLEYYDMKDQFSQDSTDRFPDSSIFDYAIQFTFADNFKFIIDDIDIYAQTKNIVFMEINFKLNAGAPNNVPIDYNLFNTISNDVFLYLVVKDGTDVFLRKVKASRLKYRKIFYNMDFINIKNNIVR